MCEDWMDKPILRQKKSVHTKSLIFVYVRYIKAKNAKIMQSKCRAYASFIEFS